MNDIVPLLKHNPSAQDPGILEAITVQREELITRLVDAVLDAPSGLRHQLLVGPRGMGKTHILTLVASRVREDQRSDGIVLAWLDEDPWSIRTYDKFLAAIAARVAAETGDPGLELKAEALRSSDGTRWLEGEEALRDALGRRRLVLLVENLDEVFRRIGPEGQAKLRAFVENWRQLLILATSPQLFEDIRQHASPFYGFFAITHLDELSLASAEELLKRVAVLRNDAPLLRFLGTETATRRLETIEALAGGHPRIWLLFAGCISIAAIDELVPLFLEALDELTPYYQDRLRELSDQQQELVVLLAEAGGALSNRALAERSGIAQNQVATMLRHLTDRAYVRAAEVDEAIATGDQRLSYWELREPLMRLCLDVKQARGRPLRMVVEFLRAWYGTSILDEMVRLPVEAQLAATYAGEAFRTLEDSISFDDLLRGSAEEVVARAEQGLTLAPERLDLQIAKATGLVMEDRLGDARESLERQIDRASGARRLALRLLLAVATKGSPEPTVGSLLSEEEANWIDPLDLALVASAYEALGRTEDALAAYEKAVELQPSDPNVHHRYGVAAGKSGNYEAALAAFTKAVELDPDDAAYQVNRGIALRRLDRGDAAVAVHQEAVRLAPNSAYAYDRLGTALAYAGRAEEALAAYTKAVEIGENDAELISNRAIALSNMGKSEAALAGFEKAVSLSPEDPILRRNLGAALYRLGRANEALAVFRQGTELDPANAELFDHLGIVLSDQRRNEEALEAFEKSVELDPGVASVQRNLGIMLRRLGRLEEGLEAHERAAELSPGDVPVLASLGNVLGHLERYRESLAILERAVRIDPHDAGALRNLGAALSSLGRDEEALEALSRAAELSPEEADYRDAVGLALARLGRSEEALSAIDKAIELDSTVSLFHVSRGLLLGQINRREEALKAFTDATEADPEDAKAHNLRANMLLELGRNEEAELAARRAIELDRVPTYLLTHAEAAFDRGDAAAGSERLREALASWGETDRRLPTADLLCRILWERFRDDPARRGVVAEVVQAYGEVGALEVLGRGLVATIPRFVDPAVSQDDADAWVADWRAAASADLEIPYDMLDAARGWKRDRDRAYLLDLPAEQREILIGLLPEATSEEAV
jgi:tetratricopeptide (TPR) repeat protein